jgi:hypothetical protein
MTTIKLQLKAKHFTGTFLCNCAIEEAARDIFPNADFIGEGINDLWVDNLHFNHKHYIDLQFDKDQISAILSGNPETVIRTIELIPV